MTDRPKLAALADRVGIVAEYINYNGTERRRTSDDTRVALLATMGFDASSEEAAGAAAEALDRARRDRIIETVCVTPVRRIGNGTVSLRPPRDSPSTWEWTLELHEESGSVHRGEGRTTREGDQGAIELPIPARPPPGYHRLRVVARAGGRDYVAEQSLIVTPATCVTPVEKFGDRRLFGLWTNLYSVRSANVWGIGDLDDLSALTTWASEVGAAFIGVNPLHATRNRQPDISPYRPLSRVYRNTAYLDMSRFRESVDCLASVAVRIGSDEFAAEFEKLRSSSHVDYERVARVKRELLRPYHDEFVVGCGNRDTVRGRAYADYIRREGEALNNFATFMVLEDHFRQTGRGGNWREWPVQFHDPRSPDVQRFRREHEEEVDFHRFLQFELDRQLAEAADRAREGGMPIGLYQDLAIGTAPEGSDPWAFPGLFVDGASVGAPPDDLVAEGQNWGLPPTNPHRLRDSGYEYWIRLLRSAFAHAGALRIDHVMGLSRQFWIPAGCSGSAGAYVRFPADDLFGILALESRRHHAIVIGEDLGTVPPGFAEMLERWGILSTRVLYFERDHDGEFRSPGQYSNRAMVAVNTHDLPPLAGYWEGRDLALRREVGQIGDGEQLAAAQARRSQECEALLRVLRREGLIREGEVANPVDRLAAVHALMARSQAPLFAVSLDDLAGETEPVNLPGVDPSRYPTWSRRMGIALEDIRVSTSAGQTLSTIRSERADRSTARRSPGNTPGDT